MEHRSWAKNHIRKSKLPAKAKKRHLGYLRCAKNSNHALRMTLFWKKVKKSLLPKNHDLWVRIGKCEQPGRGYRGINWSHRGPSYQGGLGFWSGTWDSYKYPKMPDNAGKASWKAQMRVANLLLKRYGTSPWACA